MALSPLKPVVHLELHTGDVSAAQAFYARLCSWQPQMVDTSAGSYLAMKLGRGLGGGIVQCGTTHSIWLPYVEVIDIREATDRARIFGASVLLEPREGPAGWRSVIATPAGGEIAFWQAKH
jgi:predicted enzyme related to lactoylglutathione lyase